MKATAIAHPNIALSKYWGKQERSGNYPATPSLSVTLSGLATETTVEYSDSFPADSIFLAGKPAGAAFAKRAGEMLSRIRTKAPTPFAKVDTSNDFPTASGLASSASGFAALATACAAAAGLNWNQEMLSDLARQSSASAARSIYGGFVELAAEPNAEMLAAQEIAPFNHMD
ncbi:MAG: diphosphomevalonate decarboxylase, partial [Polyangiaceae bacterium]|nr:diphosphomevalonate decarboxylase [Polyangiaceae bacterium]